MESRAGGYSRLANSTSTIQLTASIFQEIHNLGNWVVNYDELLDRRQLLNQSVKVIRYKQCATQGRNILISSTASLSLAPLDGSWSRQGPKSRARAMRECRELTERFINDANEISGDIVLRAAKRGRNASELMGVVLSRYLIRHELGDEPAVWLVLSWTTTPSGSVSAKSRSPTSLRSRPSRPRTGNFNLP